MTNIALIGAADAGKTTFFAALHARYQRPHLRTLITDTKFVGELTSEGILEQVLFHVKDYAYSIDKDKLNEMADGIREVPIVWPPATRLSDFFPIDISFRRYRVDGSGTVTRDKRMVMVDLPGGHFVEDFQKREPDKAKATIARAQDSQALIVFIDVTDLAEDQNPRYAASRKTLIEIIKRASSAIAVHNAFLPVTIAFTKFDAIPRALWAETHDRLFEQFVAPISGINSKILTMSCPISITSAYPDVFKPMNIEYPFLFSAMGIIFSQNYALLQKADEARAVRQSSFLMRIGQFLRDPQTIGSMERNAVADLLLAKGILESLHAEEILNRADLRFAQAGDGVSISQIRRGIL